MELIYDVGYYFVNSILNKIPSRSIRRFVYSTLTYGRISHRSNIGIGVKFLNFRNVYVGANSNINWGSVIDGRGGKIFIGENVDIAPQVNIWTLEHDPQSKYFESRFKDVHIEDNVWIANRVIVLPGTKINEFAVIGSGSVVKGVIEKNVIAVGSPAKGIGFRGVTDKYILNSLRRFR